MFVSGYCWIVLVFCKCDIRLVVFIGMLLCCLMIWYYFYLLVVDWYLVEEENNMIYSLQLRMVVWLGCCIVEYFGVDVVEYIGVVIFVDQICYRLLMGGFVLMGFQDVFWVFG